MTLLRFFVVRKATYAFFDIREKLNSTKKCSENGDMAGYYC